jgi:hypothetical protein
MLLPSFLKNGFVALYFFSYWRSYKYLYLFVPNCFFFSLCAERGNGRLMVLYILNIFRKRTHETWITRPGSTEPIWGKNCTITLVQKYTQNCNVSKSCLFYRATFTQSFGSMEKHCQCCQGADISSAKHKRTEKMTVSRKICGRFFVRFINKVLSSFVLQKQLIFGRKL